MSERMITIALVRRHMRRKLKICSIHVCLLKKWAHRRPDAAVVQRTHAVVDF